MSKKDLAIASHFVNEAYSSEALKKQLLGFIFIECIWILKDMVAAGIMDYTGHDGRVGAAVYIAKRGLHIARGSGRETYKIIPDVELNRIFPSRAKANEYIKLLSDKANKDQKGGLFYKY